MALKLFGDHPRSSMRTSYAVVVYLACLLAAATALLPLLEVDWWWVRIGDFPRLQLLIAYLVVMLLLLPLIRRPLGIVALVGMVFACGIQLVWIHSYLPIATKQVQDARRHDLNNRLRLMSTNVLQTNTRYQALLDSVAKHSPDVLVLCEVDQRWIEALKPLEQSFAFHLLQPQDNGYGIAFYSNLRVLSAEVRHFVKQDIPSIDARVQLPSGTEVRIFAVHPNPPRPGEDTTKRDAETVLVGREAKATDVPVIVMGDLNDVGWSSTTDLFQEVSGLLDPRVGRGFYSTFDADSWIWRYPLDYLFHSDEFRLVKLAVLEHVGSDHFPLLVELSYEPDAAAVQEGPDLDPGDQQDAQESVEAAKEIDPASPSPE